MIARKPEKSTMLGLGAKEVRPIPGRLAEQESLVRESKTWRKQADLLLGKRSRLVETLSSFGRVTLAGSYRLGLMMSGDIDIKVINQKITKRDAIVLLTELISQGFFDGYIFYDWTDDRPKGFPKGFYIGLKLNFTRFNGRKWKIDVWLLEREDKAELALMRRVERRLNSRNKLAILELKRSRELANSDLPGSSIYRFVLRREVVSRRRATG